MVEQIINWALEQAPVITVLVVGFVALWRANKRQQDVICQMLEQCWAHLLNQHETPDK